MAKKLAKATPGQMKIIRRRQQKQYSQMFESAATSGTRRVLKGLSPADRKALEKTVGKKLKKVYR